MTDYYAGQWLTHRIYGFMIQVVGTTPDGGVTVMSGIKQVNTSTNYLDWQYRELGAA